MTSRTKGNDSWTVPLLVIMWSAILTTCVMVLVVFMTN